MPERRLEITTEGGLDVVSQIQTLTPFVAKLRQAGIQVSLFIDPDPEQIDASRKVGADAIELHTGTYCGAAMEGDTPSFRRELSRLVEGARRGAKAGLEVHAGHGLNYDNVTPVVSIPEIVELNIGHYLVGEAIFVGLGNSVARMPRACSMMLRRLPPSRRWQGSRGFCQSATRIPSSMRLR